MAKHIKFTKKEEIQNEDTCVMKIFADGNFKWEAEVYWLGKANIDVSITKYGAASSIIMAELPYTGINACNDPRVIMFIKEAIKYFDNMYTVENIKYVTHLDEKMKAKWGDQIWIYTLKGNNCESAKTMYGGYNEETLKYLINKYSGEGKIFVSKVELPAFDFCGIKVYLIFSLHYINKVKEMLAKKYGAKIW